MQIYVRDYILSYKVKITSFKYRYLNVNIGNKCNIGNVF